jgi:zinc transport system ATP-binding protein
VAEKNTGSIIECQNVSLGYGGHTVVRGLSFALEAGDYLCVIGENGCGKTTLLKAILRLINPLENSIRFAPEIKKNRVGYLSQQSPAKKDFPAGVGEIVLSGMAAGRGLRPFYSRAEKETADEAMRLTGVGDLKNRCFRELSGGQQRRVLIARALCAITGAAGSAADNRYALLALDEPAAGLDPPVTAELYDLLGRLNREGKITVIMVTHDMRAAVTLANRILHIKNGSYFFGSASEYPQSEFGNGFFREGEK